MRRFCLGFALIWLLGLGLGGNTAAQSSKVTIDDNGIGLDKARLTIAAQPLVDQGARVVIVATQKGGSGDGLAYLDDRLKDLGVAKSHNVSDFPPDILIYYVSNTPRTSWIGFGRNFNAALNGQEENLRTNYLNPQLRSGKYDQAFIDVMNATSSTIDNPVGARTPTVASEPVGSGFPILIGVIAVGVLGFFLVPMFLKRRSGAAQGIMGSGDVLVATQQRFELARRQAGGLIADLGAQMKDAREKQRFDKVSYPKTQTQELETRHKDAEAKFHQLQVQFDDIAERLEPIPSPSVIDLEGAAGGYDGVRAQAQQVQQSLNEMDALRKQLDTISAQAPAEVDRAKKS